MGQGGKQLFRQAALERLSTPDQLDRLVTLTSPRSWIAVLTLALLLLAVIVWGFLGRSPTLVHAQGVLMPPDATPTPVMSLGSGRLAELQVRPGDRVEAGQVIGVIERPDQARQLDNARVALEEMREIVARQEEDAAEERRAWRSNLDARREVFEVTRQVARERIDYLTEQLAGLEARRGDVVSLDQIAAISDEIGGRQREIASARAELQQTEAMALEQLNDMERDIDLSRRELQERERSLAALEVQYQLETELVAPVTGRVAETSGIAGSYLTTGQTVALLVAEPEQLEVALFVPYQMGKKVGEDMRVRISPDAIRREEFGSLVGRVEWISDYPLGEDTLRAQLTSEGLAQAFASAGAVHAARVTLEPAETPSGFAWTSGGGPDLRLSAGTTVQAEIIVRERRPVDLIIPFMRAQLGVGR